MRDFARVIEVTDDKKSATVVSLISSSCITCHTISSCTKNGKKFKVLNPHSLNLNKDDVVKVQLPPFIKNLMGTLALFFPIICALSAWFLFPSLAKKINFSAVEFHRFAITLAGLFLGNLIIFIISETGLLPGTPEITQVL